MIAQSLGAKFLLRKMIGRLGKKVELMNCRDLRLRSVVHLLTSLLVSDSVFLKAMVNKSYLFYEVLQIAILRKRSV